MLELLYSDLFRIIRNPDVIANSGNPALLLSSQTKIQNFQMMWAKKYQSLGS